MDRVVGGKFKLGRKLGSGSFGEIFLGIVDFLYSSWVNVFTLSNSFFFESVFVCRSECTNWRRSGC
jgi:hypothetical protein